MDATSDRDFVLEYLQVLTQLALHASRFAEEITLFATAEFGFVDLPEEFSTGSSAMPQKKNPDLTELVRGKVGRIHGAAESVTILLKGLPLAYNKDMQETQEPVFAATAEMHKMTWLLAAFTRALRFRTDRMRTACETGFLNAMAAATYLVHKGVPFRKAHEKIGNAVRYSIDKGCELGDLSLEELRQFGPEFDSDFFPAITLEATLDCHDVIGGTARHRVREALKDAEERSSGPPRALWHRQSRRTGGQPCACVKRASRTQPTSTSWLTASPAMEPSSAVPSRKSAKTFATSPLPNLKAGFSWAAVRCTSTARTWLRFVRSSSGLRQKVTVSVANCCTRFSPKPKTTAWAAFASLPASRISSSAMVFARSRTAPPSPTKSSRTARTVPRLYKCDEVAMARGEVPRVSILGPRIEAEQLVRLTV